MNASEYYNGRKLQQLEIMKSFNEQKQTLLSKLVLKGDPKIVPMTVDPATIAAIVSTIIKLIDLLGGDNNEYLKSLQKQIQFLGQLIDEVIDELIELRVHVDEQFKNFVVYQLAATIETVIDNYKDWELASTDQELSSDDKLQVANLQTDLMQNARMAMKYGYCHYDYIAIAFSLEIFLSQLMKKDSLSLKQYCDRYTIYFESCLNSKVNNSITFTQEKLIERVNDLTNRFQAGSVLTQASHFNGFGGGHGGDPYYNTTNTILDISGSLQSGFTFVETKKVCNSHHCPNPGLVQGNFDNTEQTKSDFIKAHQDYELYVKNLGTLEESVTAITAYLSRIHELEASLPHE